MAFTATGQMDRAEHELSELLKLTADSSLEELTINQSPARDILGVASKALAGELAAKKRRVR